VGSKNQMCEPIGGQCPCLPGVIGRICDMCQAKQGEITRKGCKSKNPSYLATHTPSTKHEVNVPHTSYSNLFHIFFQVINTSCPRAKAERIVWPREQFGVVSEHKCPYGAQGTATRLCAFGEGWQEPDLSSCTSIGLVDIVKSVS
jgi:hypothetical protein